MIVAPVQWEVLLQAEAMGTKVAPVTEQEEKRERERGDSRWRDEGKGKRRMEE